MSVTAAMIARLRRMIDEPDSDTYSDGELESFIARHALLDDLGEAPVVRDATTDPPSLVANTDWVPTYDLHAAAADLWLEKAAALAADYDFAAEGNRYQRSQTYVQFMMASRHHAARRAMATATMVLWPEV